MDRVRLVRHVDLVVLAAALPLFLAAHLQMAGYVAIAVAWLVQRTVMFWAERRVAASLKAGDRRSAMGLTGASTLGRAWFLAACVLLIGLLAEREAGLAAAVLAAVLFTVQLASLALARYLAGDSRG
ncbi:MAG: hypothetical protein M3383_02090 [Actinomycetota bacterium]|nr:hypothetical protein [Actinomycetota bacterium]